MKKLHRESSGFGTPGIVLLLVVAVLIGGTAWYVLKSQDNKDSENSNNSSNNSASSSETNTTAQSTESEKITSETDKWYLYTSKDGEYKIRLADGLVFFSSTPENKYRSIYTRDLTTKEGTLAKVEVVNSGSDNPYGLFINYFANSSEATPQGEKVGSFKTDSGLAVEEYYYLQATEPDGIGLPKGGKEYTFKVIKDSKAVSVAYGVSSSETGNVDLVKKMVKTVQLK